jgi:hypothetical protein
VEPGHGGSTFNHMVKSRARISVTWEPVGGSDILIGAEQWPECINSVAECANSSWEVWTAAFPILPAVWDTTADGFTPTDPASPR